MDKNELRIYIFFISKTSYFFSDYVDLYNLDIKLASKSSHFAIDRVKVLLLVVLMNFYFSI